MDFYLHFVTNTEFSSKMYYRFSRSFLYSSLEILFPEMPILEKGIKKKKKTNEKSKRRDTAVLRTKQLRLAGQTHR